MQHKIKFIVLLALLAGSTCNLFGQIAQAENLPTSKKANVQSALDALNKYIDRCTYYESDSLQQYFEKTMNICKKKKERKNILHFYFNYFDNHNADTDPFLIYLYDNYEQTWIEDGREGSYRRKINNLRKIIPGAQIPELISHDIDGKPHSTNEIQTKYTVLWFWDPDCDHCIEMTPVLHQFYNEKAKEYDFEVFGVEVNQDYERWKTFSDQNDLWNWINLSTSKGTPNVDFIEYFDIMTTPVIFLIDNEKKHTIIHRQITLDELQYFFEK